VNKMQHAERRIIVSGHRIALALASALPLLVGCAEILGLEPPGGSAGAAGVGAGGSGGNSAGSGGNSAGGGGVGGSTTSTGGAGSDCGGEPCPGTVLGVDLFQSTGINDLRAVAYDLAGDLYITGTCNNCGPSISVFGCPLLVSAGGSPWVAFVAKLEGDDLGCAWAAHLEAAGGADLSRLAVDDQRVWAVGSFTSSSSRFVDGVGAEKTLTGGDKSEAVALVLDPATGGTLELVAAGGTDDDTGVGMVLDSGYAYLAVQGGIGFLRTLNLPDQGYSPQQGGLDTIVFKMNATTADILWVEYIGSPTNDSPRALAVAQDHLVLGGSISSVATEGTCTLSGVDAGSSAFLLSLAFDGTYSGGLCQTFGGPDSGSTGQYSSTVGIGGRADGRFAAAGFVVGPATVGSCGALYDETAKQAWMWLGEAGTPCRAVKVFGAQDGPTSSAAVRAEPLGDGVLVMGAYTGLLGSRPSKGTDIFLQRYPVEPGDFGPLDWQVAIGGDGEDGAWSFAVDPEGHTAVLVGGCVDGDLEGQSCDKNGDGFLVRVAVGGEP
jgi:hypothetical protein